MPSEDDWIARILAVAGGGGGALRVPPGHDCAAVAVEGGTVVVTTDVLVDGVHFLLDEHGARAAARKALLVNLSDLAAAGARPLAFEVGVVLPRGRDPSILEELAEGFGESAARYHCPLAGGDTNVADGPLVLAVTVLGEPPATGGIVTREGARPGDRLSVTGPLGGSRFGRHLDFVPRLKEGAVLARRGLAHAMMDLSDGLSRDLPRLCRASGVGARLEAASIPIHADAEGAGDGVSPLDHALHDGEDFELLVAHPPLTPADREALVREGIHLHDIGEVVANAEGVTLVSCGLRDVLPARGYDHFAAADPAEAAWCVRIERAADMRALGRALGASALDAVREAGVLVALHGDLGAGKTVFVQGVAEGLGLGPTVPVVSPTYTIARSYPVTEDESVVLHHLDAYRLGEGVEDLDHAGFEDMCGDGRLTCVEWAGRVEAGLPSERIVVEIVVDAPPSAGPSSAGPPSPGAPQDRPAPYGIPADTPRRVVVRAKGARARLSVEAWRGAWRRAREGRA